MEIAATMQTHGASENVRFLITGVGMVAAGVSVAEALAVHKPDAVVHAGVAGSFDRNLSLGDVVVIVEDGFPELGAQDGDAFLPLVEMGLDEDGLTPSGMLVPATIPLLDHVQVFPAVRGITVNTVHGNDDAIREASERWPAQVETMEAGAVMYACNRAGVPYLGLRTISNYVERRNRDAWQMPLAVQRLNETLTQLIRNAGR